MSNFIFNIIYFFIRRPQQQFERVSDKYIFYLYRI